MSKLVQRKTQNALTRIATHKAQPTNAATFGSDMAAKDQCGWSKGIVNCHSPCTVSQVTGAKA